MLYDCRTDSLIPGVTLWGSEALGNAMSKTPLETSDFEVVAEDTLSKKISCLGVDASLQLSLLSGMVNVGGAAEFLNDHKSSKRQVRVTLNYKSTTKFEQLTMSQLAMRKFEYEDVFDRDIATHVVTGIVYGADAFFIFDREVKGRENKDIQGTLKVKVGELPGLKKPVVSFVKMDTTDKSEENLQCRLYGDFNLPKYPATFHDATTIYHELPELLKENSVPKKVLLYPLGKLDSRIQRIACDISSSLIDELRHLLESLHDATMRSNDLIRTEVCSKFFSLKKELENLNSLINCYKAVLKKTLATLLPKVRCGKTNEAELARIIMTNSQSPFGSQSLSSWISKKESEVKILDTYFEHLKKLQQVHLAFGPGEVEVFINDLETVVCFDFALSWGRDVQLEKMEAYIHGREVSQIKKPSQPWYRNHILMQEMRQQFRCFRKFVAANHSRQDDSVKYVVTNRECETADEFNFIFLYERSRCTTAFKLPSQPSGLQATIISCNSLCLKWDKPKHGAEHVSSYIISYRSVNDPPDHWSSETIPDAAQSSILTNLVPGSVYCLKVRAETAAGCSQESEVYETNTLPPSKPGTPQVLYITPNSVQLTWEKPKHGVELVQSYTITCYLPQGKSKIYKFLNPLVNADLSGLTPQTLYAFKVRAESATGPSPDSDPSDFIETGMPVSQPGVPYAKHLTHNSILLTWEKPKHGAKTITGYKVFYRAIHETGNWKTFRVVSSVERCTCNVSRLKSKTVYFFKVRAETAAQSSPESDLSEPIETKLSPPVGKPTISNVTYTEFQVNWQKPNYDDIQHYSISYQTTTEQKLHYLESNGPALSIVFDAAPDKLYVFRVAAVTAIGTSSYGEPSDPFETRDLPWGAKLYKNLDKIPESNPPTYLLPTHCVMRKKDIVKVHVGSKKSKFGLTRSCTCHTRTMGVPHKVLMVIGATGAGKTTLINGITNYILGVRWRDDFRFKLIAEPTSQDQSKSQTKDITAYTFYKDKGSPLQYTLTIIDTPGFGDTEGLERDKHIVSQIKELFSIQGDEGIDQLHGIGFVTQAPLARLTPTQRYVFDSILSVFGKDVADNIFLMITFADGMRPPVLDAVKAADVPSKAFFKFNNSALFATKTSQDDNEFDSMFWKMGVKSFKDFFDKFSSTTAQSLLQTREVMQERERLETAIQGLQPQITAGLAKIDELRQKKQMLRDHEADILTNKEFTYHVEETKQRKIDLPSGKYTTNCLTCNYTCHQDCMYANDGDKYRCSAMSNNRGTQDAECGVCPKKCSWKVHVNNPYRFELYQEKVTRTSEDLKVRYESAWSNKEQVEVVITNMEEELDNMSTAVLGAMNEARQSIERLQEIALRPNHLTEVEYIDILIESEKREAKPRWLDRVKALEGVRRKAEIVSKLITEGKTTSPSPIFTAEDQPEKDWRAWFSWLLPS